MTSYPSYSSSLLFNARFDDWSEGLVSVRPEAIFKDEGLLDPLGKDLQRQAKYVISLTGANEWEFLERKHMKNKCMEYR